MKTIARISSNILAPICAVLLTLLIMWHVSQYDKIVYEVPVDVLEKITCYTIDEIYDSNAIDFLYSEDAIEDFEVNEENIAVITINKKQKNSWYKGAKLFLAEFSKQGVSISEDYTIVFSKEYLQFDNFWNICGYCAIIQLIDGVEPQEIQVKYMVGSENNYVFEAVWPHDDIKYQ